MVLPRALSALSTPFPIELALPRGSLEQIWLIAEQGLEVALVFALVSGNSRNAEQLAQLRAKGFHEQRPRRDRRPE